MKKLITLLALCCLMVTGAWAQTVVATMQQLVDAASTKTATVSPFFTTSVTGGAVYSFTGNGGNSGTYIGGITNDAVDAAFTGSKVVTVAAWVYGRPSGCIFGYGDEQTGVKFMLSTSGTNTTFKTTTKGKLDFASVNFTLQEDAWNLVAFSVYGKASGTSSYRYYYGTTNGNYSTKTDKTMSTMNAASKFAIGSGNQGSAREVFSSDIANLTVITSDDYLNNPNIASLVGAAPTVVSHNYETFADGEFTYGPLNGNTWSAWSGSIPAELSALGSTYNATNLKVIEKYYTFTESGELDATFNYTSGGNCLDIAGLQVFSSTGVQIGADFHVGKAGNPSANNGYSVFIPEGGSYIVRYISTANCGSEQNIDTNGKVENAFVSGDFPVQDGKTYYIYNANNNDVKTYLHPSGTGLGLSTTCYEETAYMWTCVKNGAYYNFRNVATGKWLGFKEVSNGAYNFKLKIVDSSKRYVTLYSVDQGKYMLVNNDGGSFDQSTKADNSGWSSKYGFTECSVSNLYFSESLASDKVKWMRVANSSNTGYVMTVKDGDAAGSNLHTDATDAAAEGQLFAFVGNQENGFVIYNKKLGNTYTLTAANTNQGTAATWVLNAGTPTKWYLDETHINASSQPGYGITTSSASGGNSLNMHGGNGGDAMFYGNGASNGGSRWQFSLVDGTPTFIHYVVSGTKAHNDANNYVGVLNITKGSFASNTYVGTDVNGQTFNAYLPKTQESISISNTKLHGWNYALTGSDGNYTVTYTAEETDYQYLAFDKSAQWYRIPAIAKASNGDLVAIYDYRVCHNDVGFGEVDQVMRRSTDGGLTWSAQTKIADGNGGDNHFGAAYGDPALVADRESGKMTLITVSGTTVYTKATATSRPMVAVMFSSNNGQTWSTPKDITSQFWGSKGAMFQDEDTEAAAASNGTQFAYSGFFGSGKILQSRKYKFGEAHRLYAAMLCRGRNVKGAYVVYSDDMGDTWHLLGGDNSIQAAPDSDEPKVEELPNGDIVLSCRKSYGRYFNVWHWSTEPTSANTVGAGTWGSQIDSNSGSITKGIRVGANSCNGEILYVEATKVSDGTSAKLMLQSLPAGGGRSDVEIWYKDITDPASYATSEAFASNWERGLRVSTTSSAYSTMTEQADGKIGFFYEEGPATYCMVYVPLTIEKITDNNYEKSVAPTPALSLETESTVTSSQLSELSITFTGANAAQIQLSTENHTAYLTPKASTPAQVKAQNGKFKAAGETPAAIEGTITKDKNTDGKFNIAFEDEIPAGDYELSIPEGTFLVGTTPIPVLKANYTVDPSQEIPVNGKVYTIYNDHVGEAWYVSKNRTTSGCQDITNVKAEDNTQNWIAWGNSTDGFKFYSVASNDITLKAHNGDNFDILTEHETIGVTLANHSNNTQHQAGNRTTKTLSGGVFSTNNADWYNNEFQNANGYWSTDFVFVPTSESAYKIEGPSGAQVKIGESTYSAGQFYVTKTALTQNDIHDIVPYTASLSGNVITLEPVLKEGRVCTVKAHFNEGNAPDRYLVNNADQLTFKNVGDAATTPDKTYYWVVRATGNSTYPWSLQSYDSKYLDGNSETGALSETGLPMYIEKSSVEGCFHMKADLTAGTRWLGTWNSGHAEGFGEWNNCFGMSDSYSNWTTHYEIEPVDGVKAYIVNGVGSGSCKLKNAIDGYYEANYSFKAGDVLVVPTTTELTESDLTLDEGYTVYIEDNVITIDKIVTFTLEISTPVGYNGTAPTVTYNNESRENGYSFTAGAISVKPSQFTGNTIEGAIDYNYASAADLANAKYLEGKTYDYVKAKPCVSIVKVDEDNYTVLVDYKLYHPLWRLEKAQEGKEDNPKNKFEEVVQTSTQTGRPVMIYDASLQDIYNTGVIQDWTGFMYVDANDNLRKTNATFPLIFAGGLECVWKIIKDEEATDEKYFLRNEANKMYYDGKGNKYTEENRAGHSVYLQVFPESTTTKASASAHCMNFYDEYIGDISSDTGVWTIGNVKTGNGGNWNGQVAEFVGNYSHSSAFSFYDLCDLKNVINAESDSIKDVCLDYAAYFDGINEYSHNYGTFGKRYDDAKELHSHNSGSTSTFTNYVNIVLDETVGEIFAPKAGRLLNIQNSATLNYMKGANLSEEKTVMWLNDDDQLVSWDTGLGFAPEAVTAATATTFGNKSFQNVDRASETGDPAEGFVSPVNGTMVISFNGFNYYNDARNGKAGTSTVKAGDKATTTWWIDDAVELPMTLSPDGYTSFYAPAPTQLPEGLNAYVAATCTEAEEIKDGIRATITMQNIGQTIPAKTPVIIKGTAGSAKATVLYKTETKPDDVTYWVPDYAEVAAIPGDNLLQAFDFTCQNPQYNNGSYTDANDGNKTKYIYTLTSNGNFMYYVGKELRGFRCFLVLDKDYSGLHSGSSSAPLRVIFKDDPIVNGISTVSNTTYSKGTFDLSGRRVQNTERGLYIVNGKKVIR